MKAIVLSIALSLSASISMANFLPQGKFQGRLLASGSGYAGVDLGKPCEATIRGLSIQTSISGPYTYRLQQTGPNTFLGVYGVRAVFVHLDLNGRIQSFGTQMVVNGLPVTTEQDQLCIVSGR